MRRWLLPDVELGPDRVAKQSNVQHAMPGLSSRARRKKRHRTWRVRFEPRGQKCSHSQREKDDACGSCGKLFCSFPRSGGRALFASTAPAASTGSSSVVHFEGQPALAVRLTSNPVRAHSPTRRTVPDAPSPATAVDRQSPSSRLVHVVSPAAELEVLDNGLTAGGVGPHVMELEEASLRTASRSQRTRTGRRHASTPPS